MIPDDKLRKARIRAAAVAVMLRAQWSGGPQDLLDDAEAIETLVKFTAPPVSDGPLMGSSADNVAS